MSSMDISVVIPVYNSCQTLPSLTNRLRAVLAATGSRFEIVLVDDGSRDASWSTLLEVQKENPSHVTAIQLMRNYGQHNALMCGLRQARGNLIVTMDDDLQHPPEQIPKLLRAIEEQDSDLVYGQYDSKKHPAFQNAGSWIINRFFRQVFDCDVKLTSFRVIRRELLDAILSYSLNFTFIDGLLAWNTRRIGKVEVAHHARTKGRSGYSFRKLVGLAINMFTNFSLLPLQLASLFGCCAAVGGISLGIYYLVRYLRAQIILPGYASTIVSILVLGGIQLLALGVIGEYLGRLHLNVNRKPQYHVRRVIAGDPAKDSLYPDDSASIRHEGCRSRAA